MNIVFNMEASGAVSDTIRQLINRQDEINQAISQNTYGDGLEHLYIRVLCLNDKMDGLFPLLPPRYFARESFYMHRGERLEKPAFTLEYDMRLNFDLYKDAKDAGTLFAGDLINTLTVIRNMKQTRHIDTERLKIDMETVCRALGWTTGE